MATTTAEAPARSRVSRPTLEDMGLSLGKTVRLRRIYSGGVGNGTLLILPIDPGLEHGPIDFLPNPERVDKEVLSQAGG
ncbi:MAG: hypothetical protein KY453_01010 [Gemmatimonadetes bacterium]|nr:hypothetical protein [Gemmatimonadota bacterium]